MDWGSGEFALLLYPAAREAGGRVHGRSEACRGIALSFVEECGAFEARFQRHRRVGGAWAAIGAFDPRLAWTTVVAVCLLGAGGRLVSSIRVAPCKGRRFRR